MSSFASLPPEIIISILLLLDANSIIQLGEVVVLPITREVYNHAFLDNTSFSEYSMELFRERAKARLHVIGCCPYSAEFADPKYYEKTVIDGSEYIRMHTACEFECEEIVVQASISNGDAFVLDCEGHVHHTDLRTPFPIHIAAAREQKEDDYEAGRYARKRKEYFPNGRSDPEETPEQVSLFSERLLREPYKSTRFTRLVPSEHQYAVDDRGMIWVPLIFLHEWSGWTPVCTVKSESVSRTDSAPPCFFQDSHVSRMEYSLRTVKPNGTRNGYPCLDDHCCYVRTEAVPGTFNVRSFAVDDYVLWCLRKNGTLAAFDLGHTTNAGHEFRKLDAYGPFVLLEAANHVIGLVTEGGQVVIVTVERPNSTTYRLVPKVVEGLGNVASIAVADSHYVALTSAGEVYSWGLEYYRHACLGLGKFDEMVKLKSFRFRERGFAVDTPTKLKLPRRAYAVYAEGSYSGVLM